jgi:hypothetical protein
MQLGVEGMCCVVMSKLGIKANVQEKGLPDDEISRSSPPHTSFSFYRGGLLNSVYQPL